ncbi:MAG: ATP-binding cassette domain-containing protein [Verrucomicrobium sp.]|nr:ATP-binding cassette domain-containing protein [Verrucomicrobium sp.]
MHPLPSPRLSIDAGTRFGYRTGPLWNRQTRTLVQNDAPVAVAAGLHLFVAPNGVGKTTLIRTLAGLSPTLGGQLKVEGRVLYLSDELRMDEELKPKALFRSLFRGRALDEAERLASVLKLNLACSIGKLSRGNRQKVLLIMAETRLQETGHSVLLMDEPLSGLDAETREVVTELWADASTAALRLVILHELESVSRADSLFTIRAGQLQHAASRTGATWLETYQALQK